ncbi:LPXTG cell wall anchor domain-containing protein, partial [Enterococcus gallinarum]
EGSAVEVVESVTSETAGTFEAKVKVTFKNGSSRIVTVPVTVKEQTHSNPTKEESSIPVENNTEEVMNQEKFITVEEKNSTSTQEKEIPSDKSIEDQSQEDSKGEKDPSVLADENKLPKTGDTSNLFSLLGGLFLSAIGIVGIFVTRHNRRKKDNN